jgi:hypothetical protein
MSVLTQEFDILAQPTSVLARPANSLRGYLQIQNKSGVDITYKFGSDFLVPTSAVQKIKFSSTPTGGNVNFTFKGQTTAGLTSASVFGDIQTAFQALSTVGSGNCIVTGTFAAGFTFTFAGSLANMPQPQITVTGSTLTDNTVEVNVIQAINFSAPPTAGTIKFSFGGDATDELAYNESANALETALNALDHVAGGISALTQDGTTKDFSVTFGAAGLANAPQPLIQVVDSTLTNNTANASAVFVLYAAPTPKSGNYALILNGLTTALIAWNASSAAIQSALEATLGAGNVTVSGTDLVSGMTITLGGTLANTAMDAPIVTQSTLDFNAFNDDVEDSLETPDPNTSVITSVTITTAGQGPVAVTTTVVTTVVGATPVAVTATVTDQVIGVAPTADGTIIHTGGTPALWDSTDTPIDAIYVKAAGADAAVTIIEG